MKDALLVKVRDNKLTWPIQRFIEKLGISIIAKSSHFDFQLKFFIEKYQLKYCIDIGAHHGEFVNRLLRLNCHLDTICFEPSGQACKILETRFRDQVQVVNLAVTKAKGEFELFESGSVFASLKRRIDDKTDSLSEKVSGISLQGAAEHIARESWNKTLLKVDVQGSEMEILASGHDFLEKCPVMVTEAPLRDFYEKSFRLEQLIELMSELDFVIGAIHTPRFFNGHPIDCDIVFVRL